MSSSSSASPAAMAPLSAGSAHGGARKGSSTAGSSSSSSSRKQRVLWDSDSATRGGKTSIGVLLDWLAAPGNYARWRDGKSQSGETRETLCSEIKAAMQRHGIRHRENANIRTQISELERSYEAARAWLAQGGYNPHSFERTGAATAAANATAPSAPLPASEAGRSPVAVEVLRLCRYYHVLNPVMSQAIGDDSNGNGSCLRLRRAYNRKKRERAKTEQPEDGNSASASETGSGVERERPAMPVPPASTPSLSSAPAVQALSVTNGASTATAAGAGAGAASAAVGTAAAALSAAGLLGAWPASTATLASYESTQRLLSEAVREERERKRFCMEEERNKLECEKLRYQVEAAKLQLTLDRALARKRLLDAGLPQTQVDALVPR